VTDAALTVGVTGVTGTVGRGLLPYLEADPAVRTVLGIASRPRFDASAEFPKLRYRQADVRDRPGLTRALDGADVVVHLAFSLYGFRQRGDTLDRVNLDGSLNVLEAANAVGARRFIYTSSAAVYGFENDRPNLVDEDAAVDPDEEHFYSRHKAALERALRGRLDELPEMEWIFFRPCAIVGPHAGGGASHAVPRALGLAAGTAFTIAAAAGLRPPVPGPPVEMQFVHERDVGQAIHRAISARETGRIYNLGGDGMVPAREVPRLVGLRTLPVPRFVSRAAITAAGKVPGLTPGVSWSTLLSRPIQLDTTRARTELEWAPRFTSAEALASTRRALAI
jgi:nucleoside-diphosphate-sugar epimerase